MSEHISGLTDNSMKNLKTLVDADTVIGNPITTPDGTMIIPVSKRWFRPCLQKPERRVWRRLRRRCDHSAPVLPRCKKRRCEDPAHQFQQQHRLSGSEHDS